jgi:hypothetical protein
VTVRNLVTAKIERNLPVVNAPQKRGVHRDVRSDLATVARPQKADLLAMAGRAHSVVGGIAAVRRVAPLPKIDVNRGLRPDAALRGNAAHAARRPVAMLLREQEHAVPVSAPSSAVRVEVKRVALKIDGPKVGGLKTSDRKIDGPAWQEASDRAVPIRVISDLRGRNRTGRNTQWVRGHRLVRNIMDSDPDR